MTTSSDPTARAHENVGSDVAPSDGASQPPQSPSAAACTPPGTGAVGVAGCACSSPGELACAGNASAAPLLCVGGQWIANGTCAADERCNTESGPNQGQCMNLDPLCEAAAPAQTVCAGPTLVVRCGPDLVSDSPLETCQNQACVQGACAGSCSPGSACGAASCSNGAMSTPGRCDGSGDCVPGQATACAPYACGETSCKTSCTSDVDCAPGHDCQLGGCVPIQSLAAGGSHTCMLTSAGGVQCWGDNEWGELGNGSTTNSPVPVGVSGLSLGVAAIAAGGFHTCALTSPGGGVQCWGDNGEGELGNDSTAESLVPVGVAGWSLGVAAIAAGGFHSCVLAFGGGVQCWGDDMFGQLGNDSTVNSVVPVGVFGLSSGVTAIAAGGEHTCALTWAGGVQCWGLNSNGQLGNDSTASSGVPVRVGGP